LYIGVKTGMTQSQGDENVFLGSFAGYGHVQGANNVFIGTHTGELIAAGDQNVFIGQNAGRNLVESVDNIFIGYNAGADEQGNGKLIIESSPSDSSQALIYGDFYSDQVRINNQLGVGMNAETDYALSVNGDAIKEGVGDWDVTSDRRVKTDIREIEDGLAQIMKLRPVSYRYSEEWLEAKPGIRDELYFNYIAQEFAEVFPDAVHRGTETLEGDPEALLRMNSQPAQVVAIKAIQELAEQNRELVEMNQEQQQVIDALLERVDALEAHMQ
jgi:hypothetical protein